MFATYLFHRHLLINDQWYLCSLFILIFIVIMVTVIIMMYCKRIEIFKCALRIFLLLFLLLLLLLFFIVIIKMAVTAYGCGLPLGGNLLRLGEKRLLWIKPGCLKPITGLRLPLPTNQLVDKWIRTWIRIASLIVAFLFISFPESGEVCHNFFSTRKLLTFPCSATCSVISHE